VQWTESKLRDTKRRHEEFVKQIIGIPIQSHAQAIGLHTGQEAHLIKPRGFAFIHVRALSEPYKSVLRPMLLDRGLNEDTELGILMCEYDSDDSGGWHKDVPWTVFVKADWLRWVLSGKTFGYNIARDITPEQIYGQMPAWPDSFVEFLEAIVRTNITFEWRRHPGGYLVLSQS
jgi:hypothetical protein